MVEVEKKEKKLSTVELEEEVEASQVLRLGLLKVV